MTQSAAEKIVVVVLPLSYRTHGCELNKRFSVSELLQLTFIARQADVKTTREGVGRLLQH